MKKTVLILLVLMFGFGAVDSISAGSKVGIQSIMFYERPAMAAGSASTVAGSEIQDIFQTAFLKRLRENGMEIVDSRAPIGVKITIGYITSRKNDARLLVAKMSIYKKVGQFSSLEVLQLSEGVVAPEAISEELDHRLAERLARALAVSCADEVANGAYKEEL